MDANRRVIEQFRAGGEIEGMHRERLLLLTTTGRKSGNPYTTPMMFHRLDDDRVIVIASNIGAPTHPDWYLNLEADPTVTVEVGTENYQARAIPTAGPERTHLWTMLKSHYPFFADHETKTDRTIPVVVLERAE